jgi:flagellar basal-body rod protein FlgC
MRVVSENLANAQSTGATPGADPYARKTVASRMSAISTSMFTLGSLTLPFASAAALAGSCSVRNGALSHGRQRHRSPEVLKSRPR